MGERGRTGIALLWSMAQLAILTQEVEDSDGFNSREFTISLMRHAYVAYTVGCYS